MAYEYGNESEGKAAEEIEHHVYILLLFHEGGTFVHEGGESGESTTKACGEQQFGGG